jgi:hypothetical protein
VYKVLDIQSTAGNEHQSAAYMPYILYKNTINYIETLSTDTHNNKG